MNLLRRIDSFLAAVTGTVAIVFLLIMMVGTAVDATMRFVFNSPIPGVFELAEAAMVVLVYFGLGWAQSDRKHIRATMLVDRLSHRPRHLLEAFAWALSALFLLALAIPATEAAHASFSIREFRWGSVQMPIWWIKIVLAVGLWLGVAQMLRSCLGAVRTAIAEAPASERRPALERRRSEEAEHA
ncbi:hypothetical protein KBTX_03044 [wastewater metagenome]|uniref:Tripartite ATP-independent periplasmic transporters DctQ component domain-containing protein n=2 Tax=unclassified sequences TaxID=12908 RepID=A0A5B8RGT4_9ZZZZ|nr:TRAP transporter small permease [Arhodomonas sp. KWT]QEA06704.1 hypothetical protein KBTEX_03044 [uncultured organism]